MGPNPILKSARRAAMAATVLALTCPVPAPAAGIVQVSYVKPDLFSDAGRTRADREQTMSELTAFVQSLAPRLADGRTLRLQFDNIDLAGEMVPFRMRDVRVLRGGADWPRLDFHYALLGADRNVLTSGEAHLADMNYLDGLRWVDPRLGDLPFEKRMLLKWFDDIVSAP